jgi:hypothetical protein
MKRHSFDIVSFVFGVIFLGLGVTGMFVDENITFLEARWIWPTLLVVAGVAIVGFTLRRDSSRGEPGDETGMYNPVD